MFHWKQRSSLVVVFYWSKLCSKIKEQYKLKTSYLHPTVSYFFPEVLKTIFVSRKVDQLKVEQALFNDYNDRIWLPWNNGGNSSKIHAGFFKFPIIIRAADLNHRQN